MYKKSGASTLYIIYNGRSATGYVPLRISTQSDGKQCLLALVSVLAQSLLTLVSSHLVALVLLSVWHNLKNYYC